MPSSSRHEYALHLHGVSKSYGIVDAVRDVTITIEKGEFCALIGPNGAGKSTLIKMIVGLLKQDTGFITVFGKDTVREDSETKGFISYISDEPTPYEYLTGEEFIMLTGRLRGVSPTKQKEVIRYYTDLFGIEQIMGQRISEYSRGSKQKIAFISAMVQTPRLLIIDEPVVGLDPTSIAVFGTELTTYVKQGGTVLLATHILSFATEYAHRAVVIHEGVVKQEHAISAKTNLNAVYQLAVGTS